MVNSPVRNDVKNTYNKLIDIKKRSNAFDTRMDVLEIKVDGIVRSWLLFFPYLNMMMPKWGEKVVATKNTPEPVLRKDDDDNNNGNDGGGNEQTQGTSDVVLVSSAITRTQFQTKKSTHVSASRVKTVTIETVNQHQIMMENNS